MDAFKCYTEQIKRCDDFRDDPARTALLVTRMRAGDREAEFELMVSTLKFVMSLATTHCRRMNSLQDVNDLAQEGNRRVLAGICNFDPAKSSLESFIRFRVKCAFIDHWYKSKAINHTGYGRQVERLVGRARAKLKAALGREPAVEELAEHLEMDEGRVREFLSRGAISFVSIDGPEDEDGQGGVVVKLDPASADKTPLELAELAELTDLAVRYLGREDAELLLLCILRDREQFRDLYFKYKRKPISDVNARKYKERLIKKLRARLGV